MTPLRVLLLRVKTLDFHEYALRSLRGQAPKDNTGSPFLPSAPPLHLLSFLFSVLAPESGIGQGRKRRRRICVLQKERKRR